MESILLWKFHRIEWLHTLDVWENSLRPDFHLIVTPVGASVAGELVHGAAN